MPRKESTTTQPDDFSNDRFETILAEGRAAIRRSKEARAAAETAQTHHDKKWQERQLEELKEVKERRRQTRERMAEVHKVWMGIFSPLEAKATEAPVVADPAPRTLPAGRPRNKKVVDRDNLIASLRQSKKSFERIGRNKKIARSLDEQGKRPPESWGVRTFVEATENPKTSRAFDRMVAKAQFKKVSTP